MEKLELLRRDIATGKAEFGKLAAEHSDCGSAKRGGDLGRFRFRDMQPQFSEAAFSLDVGQLSGPVVSDSGIHIIERLE